MTGPIATCVGYAGGSQPPREPTRLPSHCEAAVDPPSQTAVAEHRVEKRIRSSTRGLEVQRWLPENPGKKIPVTYDLITFKAYSKNSANFVTHIGIIIRDVIPRHYYFWDDVPDEDKAKLVPRLKVISNYYDFFFINNNFFLLMNLFSGDI